jgi:hypothetical protein
MYEVIGDSDIDIELLSMGMSRMMSKDLIEPNAKDISAMLNEQPKPKESNYFLAVFFLCLSCFSYSAVGMFVKIIYRINPELSGFDILLNRSIFGLAF